MRHTTFILALASVSRQLDFVNSFLVSAKRFVPVKTSIASHDRRQVCAGIVFCLGVVFPKVASSQPAELAKLGTQAPLLADEDKPFVTVGSVKYKDMKEGVSSEVVKVGSKISICVTGRLLNLNGVNFYNTK